MGANISSGRATEIPRTLTIQWMWGDSGEKLLGHGFAKRNPFRWSAPETIQAIISDLEGRRPGNSQRPVQVEIRYVCQSQNPPDSEVDHDAKIYTSALQETFPDVDSAIAGLQKYVVDLGDAISGNSMKSPAETISVLLQVLRTHLTAESAPGIRWSWADVGFSTVSPALQTMDTTNTLLWSQWLSLEQAIEDLDACRESGGSRPVWLHIKSTSMRYENMETGVRFEERIETAEAAIRILRALGGVEAPET
mmetsp:Transcript_71173/g.123494  ORF Transcript_71173/g.123494 Transcript_71173/m.123494 type:complete len:251 (+) Transcript_71173:79-831(+)